MFAATNIPYSGMHVNAIRMAVSANNVANVSTPGFKPSRVDQASATSAQGGTRVASISQYGQSTLPAAPAAEAPATAPQNVRQSQYETEAEPSEVDLARERTDQISAARSFDANARVLRAQDQMLGTVVDLTA